MIFFLSLRTKSSISTDRCDFLCFRAGVSFFRPLRTRGSKGRYLFMAINHAKRASWAPGQYYRLRVDFADSSKMVDVKCDRQAKSHKYRRINRVMYNCVKTQRNCITSIFYLQLAKKIFRPSSKTLNFRTLFLLPFSFLSCI